MERSVIRDSLPEWTPDFAALHPGYGAYEIRPSSQSPAASGTTHSNSGSW
ncbi:hypothetical protein ACVWW1_003621 [Bradyrhizobium sp. JR3.5]